MRILLLLSKLAAADASLPADPLGLAGRHRLPGERVDGTCHDLFFEMTMDLVDIQVVYQRERYRLILGDQSLTLRREGARLVGETVRPAAQCGRIRERWSLERARDGRVVGDYLISEPEHCPAACNGRWQLGRDRTQFRF